MKINLIVLCIIFFNFSSYSQNKKFEVKCGDKVENSFVKHADKLDYYIYLESGDNLKMFSSAKYGEMLKYNMELYDPAGNRLKNWEKYTYSYLEETGLLPATGKYNVRFTSYHTVGDFVTEFVCEKSNGDVIKNNPKGGKINPDKAQFLSVDFGTPVKGKIISGTNQLFGFKTDINGNTTATLEFSIMNGNVPLEIQILDSSDKSVIFFSSFGMATKMQTEINFSKSSEYIVSIKESSVSNKRGGKTEFQVVLK